MIKVFVAHSNEHIHTKEGFIINPTIFPDGTSQVWKLDESLISALKKSDSHIVIVWQFESDSEIVHLSSLCVLIRNITNNKQRSLKLVVPFLPGARQDKEVSNNQTFNRSVYASFINALNFDQVTVLDVHSDVVGVIDRVNVVYPFKFYKGMFHLNSALSVIVYPDHGALERYSSMLNSSPVLVVDKERDPLTGAITSIKFRESEMDPKWKNFLIVDDICDGGATFIATAKLIKEFYPESSISLAVTHGIFSRGLKPLAEAGIETVYTTDSLVKNLTLDNNSLCLYVTSIIEGMLSDVY
jgi:ribose-phosphate pyrophosphokinase